jgi:long-chain acyl-CoA synthetase
VEVRYLIDRAVREYRRNVAVAEPGRRSVTFHELNEKVNRLAHALRSLGLEKGDRVAVLLPNCREYLEAYMALAKGGFVRVTLNIRLSPPEHGYILGNSGSRAIIVAEEFLDSIVQMKPTLRQLKWLITMGEASGKTESYENLLASSPADEVSVPLNGEDVFRLHYTSGTTGRPKGAIQTHMSRVVTTFNTLLDVVNLSSQDKVIHVAPLTHASGNLFLPAFIRGAVNMPLRRFDPPVFLETIEKEGITTVFLAPTMIIRLLAFPDLKRYDLSSLQTIIYGGAPMPVEKLKEGLQTLGRKFVQIYGLAEATWADTVLGKEDHDLEKPELLGSIGRELKNVQIRVVDEEGKEVEPGKDGEIAIRGAHLMREYWGLPEGTAAVLRDGWFHTGDIARMDANGYITVVDRKGEMIISGGLNVYPKEVEDVLYRHPAILEAAVFGAPDREWGEIVKAVVFLKEGKTLTEEEVIAHCRENLASYKKPRSVDFWKEPLPKNSAGKILRRTIREEYWKGFERRVH